MANARNSIPAVIVDEASEWFVLMRDQSASSTEREAFAAWLRSSPVHMGAYLDMAKLWNDSAYVSSNVDLNEPIDNVVPLRHGAELDDTRVEQPGETALSNDVRHRDFRPFVLVAGLLIACMIGVGAWWSFARTSTYTAGVGEQRLITLTDGSVVQLNARSRIAVRTTSTERYVDLIAGQALFQVAHDETRPFIVQSGGMTVRAVGTQFDVNRLQATTIVTVVEGRVQLNGVAPPWVAQWLPSVFGPASVQPNRSALRSPTTSDTQRLQAAPSMALILSAGDQATIGRNGDIARQLHANVPAAIGWVHQELFFQGRPLREVIEEFNRYSQAPIVLADQSLGDMRVNAVFHTTSADSLLRFVSRLDGIKVDRSPDGIVIYRSP
jgi:transmembrane sensor